MKKVMFVFLCLLLISIPVFAGGGKEGGTGTPKGVPTAKTITLWFYMENKMQQEVLDGLIQRFNGSQTGIVAQSRYIPFADFKKQLSIGATASELPDIVIIDNPDHASYAAMGIFADISGKIDTSQYYDGPLASCSLNGKLYGVPFGSNCIALFYNKDILAAAGRSVPATWDELRVTAKALTANRVSGIAFSSLQNEEGTFNFLPWLWSTGTDSFQINNPQGIKALTFVGDLVNDGSMPREAINWTQMDVKNQFVSGNIAMMINGLWQVPTMREEAPNLNWDVAVIPRDARFATGMGGENWAVINNENTAASLEFIKWITSPDVVKSYVDRFGYIAPRKDVAAGQFSGDVIGKKFADMMQYALPRGPHARWPEISDAISLAFNEVITKKGTPAQAAAKAQATIDDIVK
jgi:multiple sugar transport system substrate-binding protein